MAERSDDLGYWESQSALSKESKTLMRLEREATTIVTFQPLLIPGLVQTADYVRALMTKGGVPKEDIDGRVAARMARQAILSKDEPPKLHMIVDEMVLRRVLTTPKIMVRQLKHLLEAAEGPSITVQVLPLALQGHPGLDGSFTLLDFPRNRPVVHLEHKISGLFLEEPDEIEFFRHDVDKLSEAALSPTASVDFVATVARNYERE
jgi:hypothetical protein